MPVCVLFSGALLLDASSNALTAVVPALALRLNPLNAEARLATVAAGLDAQGALDNPDLRDSLAKGMALHPADARFVSLAGIVLQGEGDNAGAEGLFDRSLAMLPTELQALLRKISFTISRGEHVAAAGYLATVGRRWGEHWQTLDPVLPVIASDAEAMSRLADALSDSFTTRQQLVQSLIADPRTLPAAFQVVERWHANGVENSQHFVNLVTVALVGAGSYSSAYRLFRVTLEDSRAQSQAIVFNGDFAFEPNGNSFDWVVRGAQGASLEIVDTPESRGATEAASARSLAIRFLDSPANLTGPQQLVRLAPARYRLSVSYSSERLQQPRPVRLEARCEPGSRSLASLPLEASDREPRIASTPFEVRPDECQAVRLRFMTENLPESWRNRYDGRLLIHRVSIEPEAAGG